MNKKIIALIIFLMAFSSSTMAQVRFGGTAGVNIANITDINQPSKSRVGFQAGVLALVPIDNYDMFYIQPGIIYSNQGEYWGAIPGYKDKTEVFLNYINVPVLLKIYFSPDENEFFGYVGPQFGFKISDKIEMKNAVEADDFNSFDLSALIGIGYSLGRKFEVFAQYSYGFMDVAEADRYDKVNHNSNLSFGLSYFLY